MEARISDPDQRALLRVARQALEARVRRRAAPALERGTGLDLPRGAFVTIHHRGDLRGCLGRLVADWPLARAVAHLAAAVADSDARFQPVSPGELADVTIEISVLTPERDVTSVEEIEVGRHGVIVELGRQRGLLLPQVAIEHGWDRYTLLAQTCVKAGLPIDAWRHRAHVRVFEAQVFRESTFGESTFGESTFGEST